MLGQSWMEDPRRFLSWRLARLCIEERTEWHGVTIWHRTKTIYQVNGKDITIVCTKARAGVEWHVTPVVDYVLSLVEAPRTRQLPLWGAA